ncbi:uncharacterized protein N7503_009152 [Penicillium pulvis]|uniref:uncharacterized protein n=1 Tax=Penicillium pulvis TaxID=1562058 RepID=UPI002547ADD0|nr:uncharacterized protein N7503_009152 [Penicillium pulvis]KAJ5793174.1 hypothetical protein N7503_009152 [Penicillium pulvis]
MDMDAPPPPPPPPPLLGATDPRLSNQPPRSSINASLPPRSSINASLPPRSSVNISLPPHSSSNPIPTSSTNLSLPTPPSTSRAKSSHDIPQAKAGGSEASGPQDSPMVDADSSNILTILAKFNESHFNILNQQNEKKRLEDIAAQNKRDVERAKIMRMYPATAEMYQQMKERSDNDISRLNKSLNQHQAMCQQITAEFAKHQNLLLPPAIPKPVEHVQSPQPSVFEIERVNRLEAELIKLKEAKSVTQTSTDMPTKIQNSIVEHSTRISRMLKDIGELSTWRNEIRDGKTKLPLETMPLEVETLAGEVITIKERVEMIHPDLERSLAVVAEVPVLQARFDLAQEQQSTFIATIDSALKTVKASEAEISGLETKIANTETMTIELKERFGNMEIQRAEISQNAAGSHQSSDQGTDKWADRVVALETAHSDVNAKMKALLSQGAVWTEACNSLNLVLKKLESKQDSFKVALRSIEMRYENINTESLVKQMTHAICEMYPTLPQIAEQVKNLKSEFSSNIRSLADRIDKLDVNVSSMPNSLLVKAKDAVKDQLQPFERQFSELVKLDHGLTDKLLSVEDRIDKLTSNIASMPDDVLARAKDDVKDQIQSFERQFNGMSIPDKLMEVMDAIKEIEQVQGSHSDRISRNLQNVNDLQESSNSLSTAFQELADDHSDDVKKLTDTCDQLSFESKTQAETQHSRYEILTGQIESFKVSLEELQIWANKMKVLEPVEDIVNICGAFGSPESIESMRKRLDGQENVFAVIDQLEALATQHSEQFDRLRNMTEKLTEEAQPLQNSEAAHPVGVVDGESSTRELHIRGSSTLADVSNLIELSNDSNGMRDHNQPLQTIGSGDECETLAASSVVAGSRTPLPLSAGPSEPSKKRKKNRKQDGKRLRQSTGSEDESSSVVTGSGTPVPSSSGPSGPPKKKPKTLKQDSKREPGETSTASTASAAKGPSINAILSSASSTKRSKRSKKKEKEKETK